MPATRSSPRQLRRSAWRARVLLGLVLSAVSLDARVPAWWEFETADGTSTPERFQREYLELELVNGAKITADATRRSNVLDLDWTSFEYAAAPNVELLNPVNGITIAFWAYATSWAQSPHLLQKGSSPIQYRIMADVASDEFVFNIGSDEIRIPLFEATAWIHVAATYDGETMRVYFNGVLRDSLARSGTIPVSSDPLHVGNRSPSGGTQIYLFNGKVDDLLILPYQLTQESIAYLKEYPPITRWRFDESSGSSLTPEPSVLGFDLSGTLVQGAVFDTVDTQSGASSIDLSAADYPFLEFGDHPAYASPLGFSVSLWIRPETWTSSATILTRGRDYPQFSLRRDDGAFQYRLGAESGSSRLVLPEIGAWTQLALTYNGHRAAFYQDAELAGNPVFGLTLPEPNPSDDTFVIGTARGFVPDPAIHFDGKVDELVITPFPLGSNDLKLLNGENLDTYANGVPQALKYTFPTSVNTPAAIALRGIDPDEDPVSFTLVSGPDHGSLSGTIPDYTYTPDPGFFGRDVISFTVTDSWGDTSTSNDTIIQVIDDRNQTVADSFAVSTNEDVHVDVALSGFDADGDPLSFRLESDPEHGKLTGTPPNLVYTPMPDYSGEDRFSYSINDSEIATVTISVNPVNDAPFVANQIIAEDSGGPVVVDVLDNAGDVDGDSLSVSLVSGADFGNAVLDGDTITYTPGPDFDWGDTVVYSVSDGTNSTEGRLHVRPPDIFPVTHYGAAGDGVADDTEAIQDALDAAGSYAAVHGAATVFIPDGTYLMTTRGTVAGTLYRKDAGVWTELGAITDGGSLDVWSFGDSVPINYVGKDGDRFLETDRGVFYERIDGAWVAEDSVLIVDQAGDGWLSGYGAPSNDDGSDGDYYFDYYLEFGYGRPCITIRHTHNGVSVDGESRENTILTTRAWSGIDPMDYEVELPRPSISDRRTSGVISSRLPWNSNGFYVRGSAFVFAIDTGFPTFEDITLRDFTLLGNTTYNGKHKFNSNYDRLEQWDITHKSIVFTFGGPNMNNIVVDNCTFDGFRGEILYRGGTGQANILIQNSTIRKSNGSAISISGAVTVDNCIIEDVYNGTENYAVTPGQFTIVKNSIIRNTADYGIVYIGQHDDTTYLEVTNNEIYECGFAAIFLSEFAFDVTIEDNLIQDTYIGVYLIYLNQYEIEALGFNDLSIKNNEFVVTKLFSSVNRGGNFVGAFLGSYPAKNWVLDGNTIRVENDGKMDNLIDAPHPGPMELREGFVIKNNNIYAGVNVGRSQATPNNQIRPLSFDNNYFIDIPGIGTNNTDLSEPFTIYPLYERIRITSLAVDGKELVIGDMDKYPEGFEVNIINTKSDRGVELKPDPTWNTFTRGYMLYEGASIDLEFGSGKFSATAYTPRTGTPQTITSGTLMAFKGFNEITLDPSTATLYDAFSGIPENVTVTINYNANSQFADNDLIDTTSGTDWNPGAAGSVTAIKQNGVLEIQGP